MKKKSFFLQPSTILVLVAFLLLGFMACKSDKPIKEKPAAKEITILPDKSFGPFYDQFHRDSVYQMSHINFPLQGDPNRIDSVSLASGDFYWHQDEWVMQKDFDESITGYTKQLKVISPDIVEETILHSTKSFGVIRRFVQIDKEWYLVYFSGMIKMHGE